MTALLARPRFGSRLAAAPAARFRRRGASYLFFLGTAMLLTIVGLSALSAVRVGQRGAESTNDRTAARLYAQSAVEQALLTIYKDSGWRDSLTHDAWSTSSGIGEGTFSWKLVDSVNGSLTADRSAPLRVYGRGVCGESVWTYSVAVQPPQETAPSSLLINGDLESGVVSPWTQSGGCALQISTSTKHGGTSSLRVSGRSAGSSAAQSAPGLTGATSCRASAWIQMASGTVSAWCGVWVQTDAGWEYLELARVSVGSTWTQLSGTVALPSESAVTSVLFVVGADGSTDFNVDDARLLAAPAAIGEIPGTWRREPQ